MRYLKRHWRSTVAAVLAAAVTATLASGQPGVNNNYPVFWSMLWEGATFKPTYSATSSLPLMSSPDDVCAIVGSSTKTVRVRRIIVSGTNGNVVTEPFALVKRSTLSSGGWGSQAAGGNSGAFAMSPITPNDSSAAAATAVAERWIDYTNGTAYTPGTIVTEYLDIWLPFASAAPIGGASAYGQLSSTELLSQAGLSGPITLRGTSQQLVVNLSQVAYTRGTTVATDKQFSCTFVWTEDNDN